MSNDPYVPLPPGERNVGWGQSDPYVPLRAPAQREPFSFSWDAVLGVLALAGLAVLAYFLLGFIIRTRNEMVDKHQACQRQQASLNYLVNRRQKLIAHIYDIAQGLARHETSLHGSVLDKLAKAMHSNSTANVSVLISDLLSALPGIAAAPTFSRTQEEISRLDGEITRSLHRLNELVEDYNTYIALFPNNMVAGLFGYRALDYVQQIAYEA